MNNYWNRQHYFCSRRSGENMPDADYANPFHIERRKSTVLDRWGFVIAGALAFVAFFVLPRL